MENQGCPSLGVQKEERSPSEGSCSDSECSCEACCNAESGEESAKKLELNLTGMKDSTRDAFHAPVVVEGPDTLPVFQSLASPPQSDNLSVAIEALHVKQARFRSKKQRHCSFCKIHGFPINIKGHKPFCQFRETCMCKGCTLIRCNQKVSKSQVRLRRQKDMEVDLVRMAAGSVEHHQDMRDSLVLKKRPMCFKCWIHDSVRVRLKGHRNVCPYTRCACSNCSLNTDRKRLTRELRQLAGTVKNKAVGEAGGNNVSEGFGCVHLPTATQGLMSHQCNIDTSMLMSSATTLIAEQYTDSGLAVVPVKIHKAGDWHINRMVSPVYQPTAGLKQTAAADFQSIFSGKPHYASSFPFAGPVLSQEQSSQLSNSKWLPSINFTPSSSFDMVSRSHGTMSPILTTANSNYHNGVDFTTNSISRAGQSNNLYNVFPQHTGLKSNEVAGTVMLGNAGCVGYPVCPVSSSLSGWSN